ADNRAGRREIHLTCQRTPVSLRWAGRSFDLRPAPIPWHSISVNPAEAHWMTTTLSRNEEFLRLVDAPNGLVDRKIFSDQEIYDLEMERIFARAWNFMAHDSQIPNAGDFFLNYIGEDRVIVVRDKAGNPQVLLNTCRHRGNAVCRAEEGHATSSMCTYHGWTYDLQGKLVGVPGFKDYYHEDLNREEWGLVNAARVETYRGFIFASLDPEAPS